MKRFLLLSSMLCMLSTVSLGMEVRPYVEGKISENWAKISYKDYGFKKTVRDNGVLGGSISIGQKLKTYSD